MRYCETYRLIGPMNLDESIRQTAIEIALGVWGSDEWEGGLTNITEQCIPGSNIDAGELVGEFYKLWKRALKLTRCKDEGPPVPDGHCFIDVIERDLPLVISAYTVIRFGQVSFPSSLIWSCRKYTIKEITCDEQLEQTTRRSRCHVWVSEQDKLDVQKAQTDLRQ